MSRILACIGLLAALGACALTPDKIDLQYQSTAQTAVVPEASGIVVQVTASEGRQADLGKVSAKKNAYGMEMAPITTGQSLPDLVRSAVEQELRREGFQIGRGPVLVHLELEKFHNDFKSGFWTGDAVAEITVMAEIKSANGRILYARSVTGTGEEKDILLAVGENAKAALDRALSSCIARLVGDPNFTQAILTAGRVRGASLSRSLSASGLNQQSVSQTTAPPTTSWGASGRATHELLLETRFVGVACPRHVSGNKTWVAGLRLPRRGVTNVA